jgi:hypothetical protein
MCGLVRFSPVCSNGLLLAGKGIVRRPLPRSARIAWAEAGSEEGVEILVAYGIPGIPLAQDPSSWMLFGWSLLLVSLGTGIVYFFKVTNVWIRGQISTSWYVCRVPGTQY